MKDTSNIAGRSRSAIASGLRAGLGTALFLMKIMVPVSLAVALLKWSGALTWAARFLAPAMGIVGLPGEAALVLLSSMLLNVYSAIAVIGTLPLTMREITILAIMCLTAHNLPIETAVMKKSGSSATKMVIMRIGWAIALAFVFNRILPAGQALAVKAAGAGASTAGFWPMLSAWGLSTLRLVVKIFVLVLAIMVGQRLMEEFHIMDFLSRLAAPVMRVFGLSESASFLWIVINIVGYAYGAAIIMERVKDGKMKPQEADLFNHHACLCHSLLEDTSLFLAIGVPLFWISVPRLGLAFLVVWFERFRRRRFRKSFKIGTV
ncbi:MAG: transporter [Spirochaetae bacterium HGW-Spirochaetae-3]|jgi:spore maturation protein SpmB|nr:MAG: transporter [Spirochaetae bacterium HGW-Spirochaetae-3]